MKKKVLAIGIIAILGIGYVGGAWYTGNIIEKNIDNGVSLLTEKINTDTGALNKINDKYTVGISYSNYQKGLFSTKLHLTVTLTPTSNNKLYRSFKETSDPTANSFNVFDEDVIIHHGPFPIAALIKGTFAPQAAWLEYQVGEKTSPELWKLAGNQPLFSGYLGISYQEYIRFKISNQALTLDKDNFDFLPANRVQISKGDHYIEAYRNSQDVQIKSRIANVTLKKDDQNYASFKNLKFVFHPQMEKNNIDYELNFDDLETNLNFMDELKTININNFKSEGNFNYKTQESNSKASIGKFIFNPDLNEADEKPSITLNKFEWQQKNRLDADNTLDGSVLASIDSFIYGQQKIGSGELDFDYQGIDINTITQNYNELNYNSYDDEDDDDDIFGDQKSVGSINSGNIKISLNKFKWHNAAGDIDIKADVDYSLGDNFSLLSLADSNRLNKLKLNLSVPLNVFARIATQFQHPKNSDVDEGEINKLKSQIELMSQIMMSNTSLISFKKGDQKGFFTDIDYSSDRQDVKVNGQTLTKDEFFDN